MFRQGVDLGQRLNEPITELEVKAREETVKRLAFGMARAADVVLGSLRRFSSNELLHARTGNLARAWNVQADAADPLAFRVVNRLPYAEILNEGRDGQDIVPKNAKALAIPLQPFAATPRGVAKYTSPRNAPADPKFFVWKSNAGNAFLAKSVKGKLQLWYLLRDKVTIPATHYADLAVEASVEGAVQQVKNALS